MDLWVVAMMYTWDIGKKGERIYVCIDNEVANGQLTVVGPEQL